MISTMTRNWKDAGSGIMLWAPAAELELDDTGRSFARLSVSREDAAEGEASENAATTRDSVLPSIEENLRVKQSIFQELFGTPDSVVTNERIRNSPPRVYTPSATFATDALAQLRTFAAPSTSTTPEGSPADRGSRSSTRTLAADTDTDYESDRTDFLATAKSPCPSQTFKGSRLQTGRTSHYFTNAKTPIQTSSVRRKLDFGTINKRPICRISQVNKRMGLAPEYAPNHKWSYAENRLLCVLWRWYEREPVKFAELFNKFFNLRLATSKIKVHFENYLRLHGPKAFLVYKHVYSIPFDDPKGVYGALRDMVESMASSLGIELHRLDEEVSSPSGKARTAKSPKTRRLYRALVRRASQEEQLSVSQVSQGSVQEQPPVSKSTIGGVTLSTNEEFEAAEILVESAEAPSPPHQHSESLIPRRADTPSLVFRVWDSNSKSIFSEEHGFVSGAFTSWAGPFPPPFPPEGLGKQALAIFMNTHLSMQGGSSIFVSTTTSLLQAFTKASAMSRPKIALIDLGHPLLAGVPHKVLHAADCLRELKTQGQAWWARYKGHTEYMIFSDIPHKAILTQFPLANLVALYDVDDEVSRLLSLEKFTPGLKTQTLSAQLRERNVTVDHQSASAMGRVAKLFGLDGAIKIDHVEQFVARLVDGWSLHSTEKTDEQGVARAFAGTLESRIHSVKEVSDAFEKGMKAGNETLAFFARRRRPGTRRVRTI